MGRFEWGGDAVGRAAMTMSPTSSSPVKYILVPETVIVSRGEGSALALGPLAGKRLLVALKVTEIIEQEFLHVSVWGSADGKDWGTKALFFFPQVFYRGLKPAALDLSERPEIKFLRARWEVNRWGRGYPCPHFVMSLEVQEVSAGG